jgi:transcriptional regulator with XRE-family HTH domain
MTRKKLGELVRRTRDQLRLSQRQLASRVGVKASHIAYIESGQRTPSLTLIRRIADALGLNRREVLFLAHPEAKVLVGDLGTRGPSKSADSWRRFSTNRVLLRSNRVTRAELKILRQVSMAANVTRPGHFLFILNSIRQASLDE